MLVNLVKKQKQRIALMGTSALQVVVNFFTSVLILRGVGLGGELDTFYIAMGVFAFLYTSICWSISSVLTQYLVEHRGQGKEGSLYVTVALMVLPIAVVMLFAMPLWVPVLFANYNGIVPLADIYLLQGVLITAFVVEGLSVAYHSMLYEKNKYVTFNALTLLASCLGFALVFYTIETYGVQVAAFNQLLIKLVIFLGLNIFFLKQVIKTLKFDKQQFKLVFHRVKYILLGSMYYRTEEVTERYIASFLTSGFVGLIGFIFRAYGAAITVLNSAFGFPSITIFADLVVEGKYAEVKRVLKKYVLALFALHVIIFIGLVFLGEWFFRLIMGQALTPELEGVLYSTILCLYAFVVGKTVSQVLQSLLMALKKGTLATAYDSAAYTFNIALKVGMTALFGIQGLLGAIVLSALVTDGAKLYLTVKQVRKAEKI